MIKKVIIAGLAGGLTIIIWSFLVNGVLGLRHNVDMKEIPNERQVYELLKQSIANPGRYLCNPELTQSYTFPNNEPVYSIGYGGMGHEAAGKQELLSFILAIIAAATGAFLLSQTSEKIMLSYPRKVLFFAFIGLLVAILSDIGRYGIRNYPLGDALLLAVNDIALWTVVGLVIALLIKPSKTKVAER